MTRTLGILLAGGASRRFPPNKLLETVDGEPLFWRPLRALASATDEVVVMIGASQREPPLPKLDTSARLERDSGHAGPLAAVADALGATDAEIALVVAGDTPDVPAALLRAMRDALGETESDALALQEGGTPRPVPLAVRPARCAALARDLVDRGILRLGVLVEYGALTVDVRDEAWWKRFDAAGAWRRDVDQPADLSRRARGAGADPG